MLDLLLQGNLAKFKEELPKMIIEILSYHDVTDKLAEAGYHLFMIGLFAQAQFRGYKLTSNKESGLGRFDIKIEPTEKAIYKTVAILEIKIVKKNEKKNNGNDELRNKAEEGLRQISEKCYRSGIPEFTEKLIECGIAFQGKQAYVIGKVFRKMNGQWEL